MRGLPEAIKPTMATQTGRTLPDMAEVADTVYSLLSVGPAVHKAKQEEAVDASLQAQMQNLTREFSLLKLQMAAMIGQVQEISSAGRAQSQQPARRRSRSRPQSRSREQRPPGLFWYHWTFRERANKCTSPCTWTSGNSSGSR
jgi:hypothetical protein